VAVQVVDVLARRYFGDEWEVPQVRGFAAEVAGLSAVYAPAADVAEAMIRRALGDPAGVAKMGDFGALVDRVGLRQIGRAQSGICLLIVRRMNISDAEVRRVVCAAEAATCGQRSAR
jgi:hypothetical protein